MEVMMLKQQGRFQTQKQIIKKKLNHSRKSLKQLKHKEHLNQKAMLMLLMLKKNTSLNQKMIKTM
jgi:hypothetical protein